MFPPDLTYQQAFEELQAIVRELEAGTVDIDTLLAKVQRASYLCKFLRQRLRAVEEEVHRILRDAENIIPEQ